LVSDSAIRSQKLGENFCDESGNLIRSRHGTTRLSQK
jgi:hypothetical protein